MATRQRLRHVGRDIAGLGADIVVLQEADRYSPRSLWCDQSHALARLTGASGVAHAAHKRFGVGEGVSVLAYGLPCGRPRAIRLGPNRVALALTVGTLDVVCVHLSATDERDREWMVLAESLGPASIVAGDFNVPAVSPKFELELQTFADTGFVEAFTERGWAIDDPRRTTFVTGSWDIDRIYARGATVTDATVVQCDSSDHWPVVADLQLL